VFPLIGDKPVADIKRSQFAAVLDYIERVNGAVTADRTLSAIRGVLDFYADRDDDYIVPLKKGMTRTSQTDNARKRILDNDEIRKLWGTGNRFAKFLLLTGARRDEVASMQWKEIVITDWTLPAARNQKTKLDLIRPLSKAAMALLPSRGQPDEYVFGNTPDKPLRGFTQLKARLDAETGIKDWVLHDLRRTARSLMSRARVPTDHAEQVLGHVLKGVRGIYDRHDYHNEKAHALEALAHQIQLITSPPKGGNVRQLKRA
jgi:integrase